MRAALDPAANALACDAFRSRGGLAGAAACTAEELARESERGVALPHSRRPVEEVRVRRALGERGVEQAAGLGLLRKALEACHAPPSPPRRRAGTRRS